MSSWFSEIIDVLDNAAQPKQIFFRDDDAGWANDQLFDLLNVFEQTRMPIDLAVIPESLDRNLANQLLSRYQQGSQLLGLHQHGYSHSNHEAIGRKCEFGDSRTQNQQKADITQGHQHLKALLGEALDPIFTPPWNRCTQATVTCLEELEFRLLSRNDGAASLASSRLKQIPVTVDWSRFLKASTMPLPELAEAITSSLLNHELTGIMLHHADMGREQLKHLSDLMTALSAHHNIKKTLLRNTLN